jgi:hypothetical protein
MPLRAAVAAVAVGPRDRACYTHALARERKARYEQAFECTLQRSIARCIKLV